MWPPSLSIRDSHRNPPIASAPRECAHSDWPSLAGGVLLVQLARRVPCRSARSVEKAPYIRAEVRAKPMPIGASPGADVKSPGADVATVPVEVSAPCRSCW
jgi:hypothetical protein